MLCLRPRRLLCQVVFGADVSAAVQRGLGKLRAAIIAIESPAVRHVDFRLVRGVQSFDDPAIDVVLDAVPSAKFVHDDPIHQRMLVSLAGRPGSEDFVGRVMGVEFYVGNAVALDGDPASPGLLPGLDVRDAPVKRLMQGGDGPHGDPFDDRGALGHHVQLVPAGLQVPHRLHGAGGRVHGCRA